MDSIFDRPNQLMRDLVEAAIGQLADVGGRRAAADLHRAGVPLPVIARVISEPGRRRASA